MSNRPARPRRGTKTFAEKMRASVCVGCRYEHCECYVLHTAPVYDPHTHSWACFWNPRKH